MEKIWITWTAEGCPQHVKELLEWEAECLNTNERDTNDPETPATAAAYFNEHEKAEGVSYKAKGTYVVAYQRKVVVGILSVHDCTY